MTSKTSNISTLDKKVITVKRTISPSGARMLESEILDFLVELDPDNFEANDFETFKSFLDDLDYLGEGTLRAQHSTTASKITARRWYQENKSKVKRMAKKRKTAGAKKKTEIMKKSNRSLTGKGKRHYNTKGHLSDAHTLNLHKAVRDRVDEMFEADRYLVIKTFTIGEIEAKPGELLENAGDIFTLYKRDGLQIKFKLQEGQKLTGLVKPEDEVTAEDYV